MGEDLHAIALQVVAVLNAGRRPPQEPAQRPLALKQRPWWQILAVELEEIEGQEERPYRSGRTKTWLTTMTFRRQGPLPSDVAHLLAPPRTAAADPVLGAWGSNSGCVERHYDKTCRVPRSNAHQR
jgi:hypothetical protein